MDDEVPVIRGVTDHWGTGSYVILDRVSLKKEVLLGVELHLHQPILRVRYNTLNNILHCINKGYRQKSKVNRSTVFELKAVKFKVNQVPKESLKSHGWRRKGRRLP